MNRATGRLIAVQIKSGKSFFSEVDGDAYVYRGDTEHLDYWLDHSLPVIVVIVDPSTKECLWEHVTERNVTRHKKGWSLRIPMTHPMDITSQNLLSEIAVSNPDVVSYRNLLQAIPWMQKLRDGNRLFVTVEEWVNKTSGRIDLALIVEDSSGVQLKESSWPFLFLGAEPVDLALARLFPWADVSIDERFYSAVDTDKWDEECGHWDKEEGRYGLHDEEFSTWIASKPRVRPYDEDDEVARWRLELTLNELGQKFLRVTQLLNATS